MDEPEHDNNEPSTLQAQLQALQAAQDKQATKTKDTINNIEKMMQQILARSQQPDPDIPLSTTERPSTSRTTPDSMASTNDSRRSKKLSDPNPLSNGIEPTFEAWRILVKGKLRANADHYPTEEDRMFYVFNRTSGNAQKHLLPRYEEDSCLRFQSATEMIQYLASIYVNPNKIRDARYTYGRLTMKTGQPFAEFQTTFLHLAGEGQVPKENLRMDLFDKITAPLQERLAAILVDLDTYEQLATRCLTLDSELRRINARVDRQKRFRNDKAAGVSDTPTVPATSREYIPTKTLPTVPTTIRASTPSRNQPRQTTPIVQDKPVTCFSCNQTGHFASACPTSQRKITVTDIEEEPEDDSSYEDAESGNEDA
jgi:hypothetical protein